jgi:hypothetical protein
MKNPLSQWLVRYGLFLVSVGIVAVLYEPKSGQLGFNPAAKTALMSGGICGGLSLAWGLLLGRGFQWARVAAMISGSLFLAAFTWRSIAGWMVFAGGQSEKWFASTLITGMWVATLVLLTMLVRNRAGRAPIEPIGIQKQPVN